MNGDSTAAAAPTVSKLRLRLWLGLLKTSRKIESELRENFRVDFESTLPRFDVMAALRRFDTGLRMSELSEVLRVSNGNVTGIVDRLVLEKLVVRVSVPGDRRASLVKLTQRGRSTFDRQAAAHEGWVDELLADVDSAEAQRMLMTFKTLFPTAGDTGLEHQLKADTNDA